MSKSPALLWMEAHAIDPFVAYRLHVREKGGALYFPYVRADGTKFVRKRPLDGKITYQPRGEPLAAWFPAGGRDSVSVLLTEGESDTLAAASVLLDRDGQPKPDLPDILAGLCPVGIPGTGYASKVAKELDNAREVFVCFDADEAGEKATAKVCEALGDRAYPVVLPEGKDLSDALAAMGPGHLSVLLQVARNTQRVMAA